MTFDSETVVTGIGLVDPQLAAWRDGVVIAWAGAQPACARRDGASWTTSVLRSEPSAAIRLASGGDGRVWGVWDAGGSAMHDMTDHPEGVRLEAGVLDPPHELRGEPVADQLWDHGHGRSFAIAVGPDHEPQVAWIVRDRVYHARRAGGTWTVEEGPLGERDTIALAVDRAGRPHVLYQRDLVLRHAVADGGKWSESVVGARYETKHVSIAVDPDGNPHLAFMGSSKSKDHLVYATRTGDGFVKETVDKKGNAGFGASLALDAAGVPTIAYRVEHSRDGASSRPVAPVEHRFARRSGGKWTVEPVAIGGAANSFTLAGDVPWIAYASPGGGLSIATC